MQLKKVKKNDWAKTSSEYKESENVDIYRSQYYCDCGAWYVSYRDFLLCGLCRKYYKILNYDPAQMLPLVLLSKGGYKSVRWQGYDAEKGKWAESKHNPMRLSPIEGEH